MPISIFFLKFLPLFIVIIFLKGVINFIFPLWFIDLSLAFALACITYFKLNLVTGISLFLVGIMRAFDGYYPLLFFPLLYIFIFWLKEIGNRFLEGENTYFNYIFWLITILFILLLQLFIFFIRVNLYSITYNFIFWILFKSLVWIVFTFLFVYLFFRLLKIIFDEFKDK